jgi:4-amino-4-deoxy-L-arabinose transferase-like glycosyltransferase
MGTERQDRLVRVSRYVLLCVALSYIAIYVVLAVLRIQYPFELEWMEGGSVDHVRRILAGDRLYVKPTLEFVTYIYTPLYFYLSSAVSWVLGIGFLPLRLVSFLSSLGCFAVIFLIVRRETGATYAGVLAASLFAATYRLSGAWFDIARVDSLFLLLLLLAVYVIRFSVSNRAYVLAGILLWLSFMTKQTALIIALPLMLHAAYRNWRRSCYLISTVIATVAVSTLALDHIHDGWYMFYIYDLPRGHEIIPGLFLHFWLKDLFLPLPVACALCGSYLFAGLRHANRGRMLFYPVLALGMLGGALSSRLHLGGYDNVLFPAYACVAIVFGLAVYRISGLLGGQHTAGARLGVILITVSCLIQFGILKYDPVDQVPTSKDLLAGRELIDMISRVEGEVLIPDHGFLPYMAGKRTYAHRMAIYDVLRGSEEVREDLIADIRAAVSQGKFSIMILDTHWRREDIEGYYSCHAPIFIDQDAFWPVTGKRTRPTYLCVPR